MIKQEYPPNYKEIEARFTLNEGTIFTYGEDIYNPNGGYIDKHLLIHEGTHSVQQGDNVKRWWDRYLVDDDFRFVQELEAYQNQYVSFCRDFKDRNAQSRFLFRLASDLSSELYGKICTQQEASRMIKSGQKFEVKW